MNSKSEALPKLSPCKESEVKRVKRLGISTFQKSKLNLPHDNNRLWEVQRKLKRGRDFRATIDVLLSSQIKFWVLKGIELSFRNYGDPLARSLGDLDVLVPSKNQVGILRSFLIGKGWYEKFPDEWIEDFPRRNWYMELRHHITLEDPVNHVSVELHWQLDCRFLKLDENKLNEILSSDSDVIHILNRRINVLKPELEFAFLLAHVTRHSWSNFKWLVDLYHFPRNKINQEKLNYWIKYFDLEKAYSLYLSLVNIYFKEEIVRLENVSPYLIIYSRTRLESEQARLPRDLVNLPKYLYYHFSMIGNLKHCFRFIDYSLIKANDVYQIKFPFKFFYYLYRPIGTLKRRVLNAV